MHSNAIILYNSLIVSLLYLAPHFNLPVRPQVIKTAGGQRLLNPIQLNNLAQILPGTNTLTPFLASFT